MTRGAKIKITKQFQRIQIEFKIDDPSMSDDEGASHRHSSDCRLRPRAYVSSVVPSILPEDMSPFVLGPRYYGPRRQW